MLLCRRPSQSVHDGKPSWRCALRGTLGARATRPRHAANVSLGPIETFGVAVEASHPPLLRCFSSSHVLSPFACIVDDNLSFSPLSPSHQI